MKQWSGRQLRSGFLPPKEAEKQTDEKCNRFVASFNCEIRVRKLMPDLWL
jgi:hypothetical protein